MKTLNPPPLFVLWLLILGLLVSAQSFPQFVIEEITTPVGAKFTNICFVDKNTGYLSGNDDIEGIILKTIDGGTTWNEMEINFTGNIPSISDLSFINADTGFAIGYDYSNGDVMFKTYDNGEHWTGSSLYSDLYIKNIHFNSYNLGYAISDNYILRITDAGTKIDTLNVTYNDAPLGSTTSGLPQHFSLIDDKILVIDYDGYPISLYRVDLENNTVLITPSEYDEYLTNPSFINNSVGFIGGGDFFSATLYKTEDTGDNWTECNINFKHVICTLKLEFVHMYSEDYGIAVGFRTDCSNHNDIGLVLYTEDGGETWEELDFERGYYLNTVQMISEKAFITIGDSGWQSKVFRIFNDSITLSLSLPEELELNCGDTIKLNPTVVYDGDGQLTYQWAPSNGLSNPFIMDPVLRGLSEQDYQLTVSDGLRTARDTIHLNIKQRSAPQICLASIDESTGYRMIIYEPLDKETVSFYQFYIDSSGINIPIAIHERDNSNFLIDSTRSLHQASFGYKMTFNDLCGTESHMSDIHRTVYLEIVSNDTDKIQIQWNEYQGSNVKKYKILRGTSIDQFNLIALMPPGSTSYADFNTPYGDIYYRVDAILHDCETYINDEIRVYNASHSNIVNTANHRSYQVINLEVDPPEVMQIQLKNEPQVCRNDSVDLDTVFSILSGEIDTYTWYTLGTNGYLALSQNTVSLGNDSTFYLELNDKNNCRYWDSLRFQVMDNCNVFVRTSKNISTTVTLFPNPSKGKFTLEIKNGEQDTYSVKIINNQGSQVYLDKIYCTTDHHLESIEFISNAGIYYLIVSHENEIKVKLPFIIN